VLCGHRCMHTRTKFYKVTGRMNGLRHFPTSTTRRDYVWWTGKDWRRNGRGLLHSTISASAWKNNAFSSFLLYVERHSLHPWSRKLS
jgi:hypothetical protein